ncbi:MAG TPA: metalloregulator ArsR/SmtB family transcription factor [Longimicrobiales bacterium]|nr:metalloregulator ArsR/SmtB family transcription factor [Longimicrobiales bacterium]
MNEDLSQRLAALADPVRGRLLAVLDGRELSVSELTAVLQLPQSTVSRHLRILSDDGWLVSRREGTSRFYGLSGRLDQTAARLWSVVRDEVGGSRASVQDAERARDVLERRRTRSQEYFSGAAGQWDAVRVELFGGSPERALLGLLDPSWTVGDLGCGTGRVSGLLAPFVGRVVAVDESPDMLSAARARLGDGAVGDRASAEGVTGKVELRQGRLEALPVADGELDVALLVLVLHYVPEPVQALTEAARALRPGGRLLLIDMRPHDRTEYRDRMGHLWQGFGRDRLEGWLGEAGFNSIQWHPLPPDPDAKGPLLFAVVAGR